MYKTTYFQRKRREGANYSLEQIFDDLAIRLGNKYQITQNILPYVSSGLFKRVANMIYAICHQGDINHVTGDINYVALLLKKKKTMLTILDLGAIHRTTGFRRKLLLNIWFKWPVYRSRWVTVISEATKLDLLDNVPCNPDKVKVIYVPISVEFKRFDKPFNKKCPTILQIGGAPNKNLERLIPAIEGLACRLLILGKISETNLILLKNTNIDYENRVGIPFEEVIDCYKSSDILFFASTFEGFGMPILEAQTVGRPVVTSNILSMPEVGGDAAFYVDPYNVEQIREAISNLINNDYLRDTIVSKGFENIKRFNPETIALQYENLYNEILKAN